MGGMENLLMGYDEVDHVIYIRTDIGFCMVQLESMQLKNLGKDNFSNTCYLPYRSFYTAVSDLVVCERRTDGLFAPLANDYNFASWGVGAVGRTKQLPRVEPYRKEERSASQSTEIKERMRILCLDGY